MDERDRRPHRRSSRSARSLTQGPARPLRSAKKRRKQLAPDHAGVPISLLRGLQFAEAGEIEKAIESWTKALEDDPDVAAPRGKLSREAPDGALFDRTLHEAEIRFTVKGASARDWFRLGTLHDVRQEWARAEAMLRRAVRSDPRLCEAWNNLGNVLTHIGLYEEAVRCYSMCIELHPGQPDVWFNAGNAWAVAGNYEEALRCYRQALESIDDPCHVWYNMGITFTRMEDFVSAANAYQTAAELNPGDYDVWYNLGNACLELRESERAGVCYARALKINDRDPDVWNNLGNVHADLHCYDEAIRCFEKALALGPCHAPWNNLANVYEDIGRVDEAIECYGRAVGLAPARSSYYLNRAMALARIERYPEALADLECAVERNFSLRALLPAIEEFDVMRERRWLDGLLPEFEDDTPEVPAEKTRRGRSGSRKSADRAAASNPGDPDDDLPPVST